MNIGKIRILPVSGKDMKVHVARLRADEDYITVRDGRAPRADAFLTGAVVELMWEAMVSEDDADAAFCIETMLRCIVESRRLTQAAIKRKAAESLFR